MRSGSLASLGSPPLSAGVVRHKKGILMRHFALGFLFLLVASCSTTPSRFSTENVMKVHQGMSSDEILALFGTPTSVRALVCGRSPDQWNCTTWTYGEVPYERASFTFSGELGSLVLNNFAVKRK